MVNHENFVQLCGNLKKNPTRELWSEFYDQLKTTDLAYYRIVYTKGKVDSEQDLTNSNAVLFDKEGKEVVTVPIYIQEESFVKGALFYLRGLRRMSGGKAD